MLVPSPIIILPVTFYESSLSSLLPFHLAAVADELSHLVLEGVI